MPVFSILLVFILLFILSSNKTKIDKYYYLFTLDCTFRIYWFQGYFLKFGDREIASLAVITELVLTLYALYLVFFNVISLKNKFIKVWIIFAVINILGIIFEVVFPYNGLFLHEMSPEINWDKLVYGECSLYSYYPKIYDFAGPYIRLIQFGINVIFFKNVYDKEKFIVSYLKVVKYVRYGVIYGIFEFLVKNVIGNVTLMNEISKILVGERELYGYKEAYMKNNMYTLQGLTEEPSHFNCFLFTYILLVILKNIALNHNSYDDNSKKLILF